MRTCYQIHTHRSPAQIERLVRTILETAEDPLVVVHHDRTGPPLTADWLRSDSRVHLLTGRGGYGGWSHVGRYLEVCDYLAEHRLGFDWMVNLSGQDYPLRSLSESERELTDSGADCFLEYFPVFSAESPWPAQRARTRYFFRYKYVAELSEPAKHRLRPLNAVNRLQPLVRVHSATGLRLGVRTATPFGAGFPCYGGSFFTSMSTDCVDYFLRFLRERPDVAGHYRHCLSPAESVFQTVLVNAGRFRLVNDCKRWFDFAGTSLGHPRTLGPADVEPARASGAHFARKWDLGRTPEAYTAMDRYVYATPVTAGRRTR